MKQTILALVCAMVAPSAAFRKTDWKQLAANTAYSFEDYVAEYEKTYTPEEYIQRSAIFYQNLKEIRQHNAGDHSWKMGLNDFTDWEDKEIKAKRTGAFVHHQKSFSGIHEAQANVKFPGEVDWRKQNVVTPVKNQRSCGSCWAFSATETLESHAAISTGKLMELSPQQMVSCSKNPRHCGGTGGCGGSTMKLAFNYTQQAGLSLESDYPYTAVTGTCHQDKIKPAIRNSGLRAVPTNNYTALMDAVANVGPVSVMVAAGFGRYEGGIFDSNCGWDVDHGVQLVGYGTQDGKDYWLIRNSWGASWGERGYIKIARYGAKGDEPCGNDMRPTDGVECQGTKGPIKYCGLCAMLCAPSYPVGVKLA